MVKTNWQDHGQPFNDFTENITAEWNKLGFSKNTCKEWLEVGLKALDYDFAYYLELQGYTPDWVLNNGSDKDLRKEYKKFLKKQPKKKRPKIKFETPRDLYTCKICDDNTFLTFKAFVRLHGQHKLDLKDPWIVKVDRPFPKQYPGFIKKTYICEECQKEKHKKDCSYYLDYQKEINQREQVKIKEQEENIRKNELVEKIFDELSKQEINQVFNNNPDLMAEIQAEIKFVVAEWYSADRNRQEVIKCMVRLVEKWKDYKNLTIIQKIFEDNPQWKEAIY